MSQSLCEECGARPASVTVTQTFETEERQSKLCALCAHARGGWLFELILESGLMVDFPGDASDEDDEAERDSDLDEAIAGVPFEALMDACFAGDDAVDGDALDDEWEDEFEELEIAGVAPNDGDLDEVNLFQTLEAVGEEAGAVCPGCGATWEQIGHDERAGCSRCYATFRASLAQLLEHVQRAPHHEGKSPRAASKRRLRLEHLRQRRDHQLQLLQSRLAHAVKAERYEEAALLRDKIKLLSFSAE